MSTIIFQITRDYGHIPFHYWASPISDAMPYLKMSAAAVWPMFWKSHVMGEAERFQPDLSSNMDWNVRSQVVFPNCTTCIVSFLCLTGTRRIQQMALFFILNEQGIGSVPGLPKLKRHVTVLFFARQQ